MSFDVHDLDTFVLVGSAVTLLAILAVRVSSRAGLPSLLIYLLMGVLLGESGFGIPFDACFDAAVGKIAHPAVYSFAHRCGLGEKSKSNALHTSGDDVAPRDQHG